MWTCSINSWSQNCYLFCNHCSPSVCLWLREDFTIMMLFTVHSRKKRSPPVFVRLTMGITARGQMTRRTEETPFPEKMHHCVNWFLIGQLQKTAIANNGRWKRISQINFDVAKSKWMFPLMLSFRVLFYLLLVTRLSIPPSSARGTHLHRISFFLLLQN